MNLKSQTKCPPWKRTAVRTTAIRLLFRPANATAEATNIYISSLTSGLASSTAQSLTEINFWL